MHLRSSSRPAHGFISSNSRLHFGYTLVEVVVGLLIFSIAAISLASLSMMTRRSSEEVVYHNTALTLAQAYVEQLRSIDYTTLQASASSATATLDLISSVGTTLTDEIGGTLANGDWARETIMLDEDDAGQPKQPMTFRWRPVLTDLVTVTGNTALGVEIVVQYETTYNFGTTRTHRGSLRTVRSNIPTY